MANTALQPTHLCDTCFVLNSTKASLAPVAG